MKAFFHLFPLMAAFVWAQSSPLDRHPVYEPAVAMQAASLVPNWCTPGLHTAALKPYTRTQYRQAPAADIIEHNLELFGWQGERVSAQIAVWSNRTYQDVHVSSTGLRSEQGERIPMTTSFIRYTTANDHLVPDIIDKPDTRCILQAQTTRPVWVQIDIPQQAVPGVYQGVISIETNEYSERVSVPITLRVLNYKLPEPKDWTIHLDLWQHPQAVARWHHVEPWSPEHFALLKPVMQRLANTGQKAITCTLLDEAWNGQTYDYFPSMVQWNMAADGTLSWDYTVFDKWVEFMMNDIGIKGQISCYTMVPWNMQIVYRDYLHNNRTLKLDPKDPSYEKIWGAFLTDFRKHLQEKGWLEKTGIALDERPDAMVQAAKNVLTKYAPELKIISAVNKPTQLTQQVDDLSVILNHANTVTPQLLQQRKQQEKTTTIYVCTSPKRPNTFTVSPLQEAMWLPMFAALNGFDGMLRWAYNSWNRDPFMSTDFGKWPPGDCFLVYPGNLSSLRFEALRDGIEEFEKIQILKRLEQQAITAGNLKPENTLEHSVPWTLSPKALTRPDAPFDGVSEQSWIQARIEKLERSKAW